jgi:hypothetical protein
VSQSSPKHFPVTWDELHRNAKALAWRLIEKGPWQGIVAVTRGGLVPAAIVARELEVRLIDTICVVSYEHTQQGKLKVLKGAERAGDGTGWLIIDDLVDTGRTGQAVRDRLPRTPGFTSPGTPNRSSSSPSPKWPRADRRDRSHRVRLRSSYGGCGELLARRDLPISSSRTIGRCGERRATSRKPAARKQEKAPVYNSPDDILR